MSSNEGQWLGADNYWETSFESEQDINASFWKEKKQPPYLAKFLRTLTFVFYTKPLISKSTTTLNLSAVIHPAPTSVD